MKFKIKEYKDSVKDWSVYEPLTPKEAIKAKCLDCCCYSHFEAKLCQAQSCPLYPLKERYFGNVKVERKKREMSDEQREALRQRMKTVGAANKKH